MKSAAFVGTDMASAASNAIVLKIVTVISLAQRDAHRRAGSCASGAARVRPFSAIFDQMLVTHVPRLFCYLSSRPLTRLACSVGSVYVLRNTQFSATFNADEFVP